MKKNQNGMLLYSALTKETGNADTYTCPMHPEVKSDKPGKCPKCGMTLVKKN
ncbi:MAG: heavy metal-binding domain-containing protein [Bacteroidota bacterium]